MRNIHLGLGLIFVLTALVFAVSSLVIMYRPWLKTQPANTETTVQLPPEAAANPRGLARLLMTSHGMRGDLSQIREKGGRVSFNIVRPGETAEVVYESSSGEAKIKTRRQGTLETLVQLHTNHGLHHEYLPANLWAAISLLCSTGLLLLGASGIYLWFQHHNERVIGGILLGSGLIFGLTTLVLTRLQQ